MKIIILGAGQVGPSLAASLVSEDNDITVVDTDAAKLAYLQDRYDLQTLDRTATKRFYRFQNSATVSGKIKCKCYR